MAVNVENFPTVITFPVGTALDDSDSRRCTFSRQRGCWTLLGDCELSAALEVPADVTLDGDGHTITLTGDAERFESAAIRLLGTDIFNLTVDGSLLRSPAPAYFAAIAIAAPGRISHTTVRNIQFTGAPQSAIGIEVAAFDGATAVVQDVTLANISGAGLLLTGDSQVLTERAWISGVTTAVQVNGAISAQLVQTMTEDTKMGVLAQDQSRVRIDASNVSSEPVAEDQARIYQDTLTFIGTGERDRAVRQAAATSFTRDRLG